MCGIVGIVSKHNIVERQWLTVGAEVIGHRGPDDSGQWWSQDGRIGFAHRRLSILDLSPAGHQPMHDATGELTIVFNGEIYNFLTIRDELIALGYAFRSHSDTEVILAAYQQWGTDCLSRFNGMFAFVLYDAKQQRVFAARDRAGEKPFFYYYQQGQFRFASELKALLADKKIDRRVDRTALDIYLSNGYVAGGLCILQGFNKLEPGHALIFNLQTAELKKWRYWDIPQYSSSSSNHIDNDDLLLAELESLLQDAVSKQLVADVPVGILLSGGVDSSLVTAMAVRASSQVQTFSVGFPGYGQLDETAHARLIAKHFNTKHTELVPEPSEPDLLYKLARQYDEPIVDSSMIPTYLVSQLVRQYCTVALGGDGGDELFGGYEHYSRLQWMQTKLGMFPYPLRKIIAGLAGSIVPLGFKGRNWLQGLGADLQNSLPLIASHFDAASRRQLLSSLAPWQTPAEKKMSERVPAELDILQRITRMDFNNYLPEDILVKVDRASMLNSLEIRAPFLDHRVIEFAYEKVPSRLKATTQDKKILLKRLCAKVLPPDFDRQRKQGFSIPLAQWLKGGSLRELFNDVLTSADCTFDAKLVRSLMQGQDRGRGNGQRLFALVMFELWRREYQISVV